jgi:hypothetical protein
MKAIFFKINEGTSISKKNLQKLQNRPPKRAGLCDLQESKA